MRRQAPSRIVSCKLKAKIWNGVTPKPKAVADGPAAAENAVNKNQTGEAEAETKTKTENVETSPSPSLPPDGNGITLFVALTSLNAHLRELRAALPPRTAPLLSSGHSVPRLMSALAARRAEYQSVQNLRQGNESSSGAATGTGGSAIRWSTADDRALEDAVIRARMGLFVRGVNT